MRQDRTIRSGVRANALWGRRGESRSNALWGSGKRGWVTLALAAMLVVPVAGSASTGNSGNDSGAFVPPSLLAKAAANPLESFDVIVQGDKGSSSSDVSSAVSKQNGHGMRSFMSIAGVQASISGKDLLKLARHPHIVAITRDLGCGSQMRSITGQAHLGLD